MALILNIETSTEVCSVALARDGVVIHSRENLTGQNHAMLVTVFIDELLKESKLAMEQLDAVAVSGGPGSYTGKDWCFGCKRDLLRFSPAADCHHFFGGNGTSCNAST